MHSQLNPELIQAIQQELAAERSLAEHRGVLREDGGPGERWRRWQSRRRVVAVVPTFGPGTGAPPVVNTGARRPFQHH